MADSNSSPIADIYSDTELHDVLVASGYGVTISVKSGHLVVVDGIGHHRRERCIPRLPRTVQRLTILGHTGYMSLESVRWLADAGICWAQLDSNGEIIATRGPQRTDARLIRAQATAPATDTGIAITRYLLQAKLAGQAANLRDIMHATGAAIMIEDYATELTRCTELDGIRAYEANAAAAYWAAWQDRVTAPFAPADMPRIPRHWTRFQGRASLVHDAYARNCHASEPPNALLNLMYKVAEAECTHALHAVGLLPGLGVLHADKPGRDSMSLDLLEAVRPLADRFVLSMLDCGLGIPADAGEPKYLQRRWFAEQKDGSVRICPPLSHDVAAHAAQLGLAVRPYAERVAKLLAGAAAGDVRVPQAKASVVRAAARSVPPSSKRPARLREAVTLDDLLPDHIWARVRDLIPEPPKRRKGGPVTVDDRQVIAVLAAWELLKIPFDCIPASVSRGSCRGRLLQWQWAETGGISAWDRVAGELAAAGHLSRLLAHSPAIQATCRDGAVR